MSVFESDMQTLAPGLVLGPEAISASSDLIGRLASFLVPGALTRASLTGIGGALSATNNPLAGKI